MVNQAGRDIDSYCGKCRLELAHIVVAAETGRTARVQCKTCGALHNFRNAPKDKSKTAPAKSTGRQSTAAGGRRRAAAGPTTFENACEGVDLSRAVRYLSATSYNVSDAIDHPTFGLGIVTRLLADNKIQVAFTQSEKTLIHNRL